MQSIRNLEVFFSISFFVHIIMTIIKKTHTMDRVVPTIIITVMVWLSTFWTCLDNDNSNSIMIVNAILISSSGTNNANTYSNGNKHSDNHSVKYGQTSNVQFNAHHLHVDNDEEENFSRPKYQPQQQRVSSSHRQSNSTLTKGKFMPFFFSSLSLSFRFVCSESKICHSILWFCKKNFSNMILSVTHCMTVRRIGIFSNLYVYCAHT